MNVILSVSSFYEVCSAVSRSISWARCLAACGYSEVRVAAIFKTDKKKTKQTRKGHISSHLLLKSKLSLQRFLSLRN